MITRRSWIHGAAASTGALLHLNPTLAQASAAPSAEVLETRIISQTKDYAGWPTLTRRSNGELLLVYSGGRRAHICPFGRVEMMRSPDNGANWSWPRILMDGPIDDRDAGVVETAQGAILVTTFTSLAYESHFPEDPQAAAEWKAAHQRVSEEQRQQALDCWMIRSTDGGVTFSGRYRVPVNSPHGPIRLSDGRMLLPGVSLWTEDRKVGVCESRDDGQTWKWLADIPTREGDDYRAYHELHAVEARDGRILVQIRNHNQAGKGETLQCESEDGGQTWSVPHEIGVWGLPSHLLQMNDGRLLMSYGYRRKPFGNQARLSEDGGRTWGKPVTISDDGIGGDLGYPSTVQLDDGSFLTVWYEKMKKEEAGAVLRQARWKLG